MEQTSQREQHEADLRALRQRAATVSARLAALIERDPRSSQIRGLESELQRHVDRILRELDGIRRLDSGLSREEYLSPLDYPQLFDQSLGRQLRTTMREHHLTWPPRWET